MSLLEFKKYNSIENSYRQKTIDYYGSMGYLNGQWVATEKVHGANFSFSVSNDQVKIGKKSCFINENENFYGCANVFSNYLDKVHQVREYLIKKFNLSNDDVIQIFGEIFGGAYPHQDVKKVQNSVKVQDGIYYCPHNDFYPFDIYIRKTDGQSQTLDYNLFAEVMNACGFKVWAVALRIGTFKECLELPSTYQTTIPAMFDLPTIDGNMSEGNVLKPLNALFSPIGERVILKNKNPKFSEKVSKEPKVHEDVPSEILETIDEISEYITENKLRNVISHIGVITQKDFGNLLCEFMKDILEDFEKDNEGAFEKLDKNNGKRVRKIINTKASALIRSNFVNIIDGNF